MKKIVIALLVSMPVMALTQVAPGMVIAANEPPHAKAEINSRPSLKVILSGFMLVRFRGTNNPCEVGIPKTEGKHNLNLYVVKLQEGKPAEVVYSFWGLPKDSIWLGVFKPKHPGIHRFGSGAVKSETTDEHDFGWAVDFEGPEYHNKSLQWDSDRLAPLIYITNGLFYSDTLTDPMLGIDRAREGAQDERYRRIAVKIADNIDFDESGPVKGFATLRFGSDEMPVAKMEADPSGKIRYEIYIENEPLDPDHVKQSDFQDYYQVFKTDLSGERFDFHFTGKATDNLPCMPGVLGGGGGG